MKFHELDWSTVTPEYVETKIVKMATVMKTKNYDEARIRKRVSAYLNDLLFNAVLLHQSEVAHMVFKRLDKLNPGIVNESNLDAEIKEHLASRALPRVAAMFIKESAGRLLVCHEKHGDSYYDVSVPELLAGAAIEIMQVRLDEGYFYSDADNEPTDQPDLFQQPEETLHQKITRLLSIVAADPIKKIWVGFHLYNELMARSEYEYERVSIEHAQKAW